MLQIFQKGYLLAPEDKPDEDRQEYYNNGDEDTNGYIRLLLRFLNHFLQKPRHTHTPL